MSDEALKKYFAMANAKQSQFKQPSQPQRDNKNPAALGVMDELFTRLKAITSVGNAFKTETEEAIVKQEWMLAFREEGIAKQHMIDEGVEHVRAKARKSRSTTWFPSVGEFIDLCKGNENKLEFAQRALNLFNSAQKQIDSVGQMVVSKHSFDLKQMKASETEKRFIELYLGYAADNAIEPLESILLAESVHLSPQQQLDKQKRIQSAQSEFFAKFDKYIDQNPEIPKETAEKAIEKAHGLKTGSLKEHRQTKAEIDEIKQKQLDAVKDRL